MFPFTPHTTLRLDFLSGRFFYGGYQIKAGIQNEDPECY